MNSGPVRCTYLQLADQVVSLGQQSLLLGSCLLQVGLQRLLLLPEEVQLLHLGRLDLNTQVYHLQRFHRIPHFSKLSQVLMIPTKLPESTFQIRLLFFKAQS